MIPSRCMRRAVVRKGVRHVSSPPCPTLIEKMRNVFQRFVANLFLQHHLRVFVLERPNRVEHRGGTFVTAGRASEQSMRGGGGGNGVVGLLPRAEKPGKR